MKLSYSQVSVWQGCPRRWFWEYHYGGTGLEQRGAPKESLLVGTAVHAALEAHYKGRPVTEVQDEFERSYVSGLGDLEEYDPETRAKHRNFIDWGQRLVTAYVERVEDTWEVEDVELEFTKLLGRIDDEDEDVYWTGRIDLVVKEDGLRRVVDHKTVKSVSDQLLSKFARSFQMVGYCWATDTVDFVVNIIKKLKTIDLKQVKCSACGGAGCGVCKLVGTVEKEGPELFVRKWVKLGPYDIQRFVLNRLTLAWQILDEIQTFIHDPVKAFPMNEDACEKYGPQHKCPFIDICWGTNPHKWWEPSEAQLANFKPKEEKE